MTMNTKINFTKQALDRLPIPEKGMTTFQDEKEKGLSIYITAKGVKTFFVRKRIHGKDERVIIGNYPDISIDNARGKTAEIRSMIAHGKNPAEEKKKLREDLSFGEMFENYFERFSKKNKKTWKYDDTTVRKLLSPLFTRKAMSFTKHDMQRFHDKITEENGKIQANRLLAITSSIFNKNIDWGWNGENPCKGIQKHREKARNRFIQGEEFGRLFIALKEETNITIRDYILISLLTAARRSNVVSMRWQDISFEHEMWRIAETKNGDSQNVELTPIVIKILKRRLQAKDKDNIWVFPSKSKTGHLVEPKSTWKKILQRAGIENLRLHDLRRTMGSYQAITGASLLVIGASLGHKTGSEATAVYSHLTQKPIRQAMITASDEMLKHAGDIDFLDE
jgi:integrase